MTPTEGSDPIERGPDGRAAADLSPCPTQAAWERVVETAGASIDEAWLTHLRRCQSCSDRCAELAGTWSRETVAAACLAEDRPDPVVIAIVERIAASPPPSGPPSPPPSIDGLADLVEIGRGGMGVVYRALDVPLGRTVAVKVLATGAALSGEGRNRARREARLLARVAHPNIVRVHAIVDVEGTPAIVMEWIDGPSLARRYRDERMPMRDAIALVRDLAGGVAAVHAAGIVHRDITPANVLLAPPADGGSAVPTLVDFGLARPEGDDDPNVTRSGVAVGTPAFMAPEQAGMDPTPGVVGPATDIHGLGTLLYWLLSGRAPYAAASTAASLRQAAEGSAPPISALVPRVPPDVGTIIATCLERVPQRRYASAGALADDLNRFLAGQPIGARRAGFARRASALARRRPVAAALAASVLVGSLAALGGLALHLDARERAREALEAKDSAALEAAALARASFDRLTDATAERFLARGTPLDDADRAHLLGIRDRYRDWPLEPDPVATLRFRAVGLARLTTLLRTLRQQGDALETAGTAFRSLDDLDARGIARPEDIASRHQLLRFERFILAEEGRIEEAIASTRATIGTLEAGSSRDPVLTRLLAVAWGDLGALEGKAGRLDEARTAFERAMAMFDGLVAGAPDDAESAGLSLTVLFNAAINPGFAADANARRAILATLIERSEAGLERFPTDPAGFGSGLLLGLAVLADTDLRGGDAAAALANVQRRSAAARRLADGGRDGQRFRDEVIGAAAQAFRCLEALGRPGDAAADLDGADRLATRALADEPAVFQRTWVLFDVLQAKGSMLAATGRRAEAIAVYRRLVDAMLPWVKDDGSPDPFPIPVARFQAEIERLEGEARAASGAEE